MPERVRHVPPQVWWILLIGAALRLGFFVVAENNGGDALARAAMTAGWLQHPAFRLNFEPWLPVHFWLMGGMSLLVRDVSFGSRALSLVLGVSTLAVFWLLVKEIYGKRAALLSLLVFTFYALHIGYSTTSSSEAPYLFFLLCGLLAFFWYRQLHSLAFLIVAAIALAIGAGIRYEAWICIFAVFLVLLLMPSENANLGHGKHVREVLSFGAIAALWPLFWMAYQWKMFAKPLYGVTMNYAWVAQQTAIEHRSALYRLVQPAGVILLTLCPIAVKHLRIGVGDALTPKPRIRIDSADYGDRIRDSKYYWRREFHGSLHDHIRNTHRNSFGLRILPICEVYAPVHADSISGSDNSPVAPQLRRNSCSKRAAKSLER